MANSPSKDYVLGTGDEELQRLGLQHRLWRPTVLECWQRAGLRAGARVLDVGCGPGYVSADLAEMVGPTGQVVGVERSPHFAAAARALAADRGFAQIEVHELDLMTDALPAGSFDAAWCRWVACFVSSPATLVAKLAGAVRPGGVVMFHEYVDYGTWRLAPPGPALESFVQEVMASWRANGGEPDIAATLPTLLAEAGFRLRPAIPHIRCGSPADEIWQWPASFIRINLQRLLDLGRVTEDWTQQVQREWDAAQANPHSLVITPLVLEIVAERV